MHIHYSPAPDMSQGHARKGRKPGPMRIEYVQDATRRRTVMTDRRNTIIKKVHELAHMVQCDVMLVLAPSKDETYARKEVSVVLEGRFRPLLDSDLLGQVLGACLGPASDALPQGNGLLALKQRRAEQRQESESQKPAKPRPQKRKRETEQPAHEDSETPSCTDDSDWHTDSTVTSDSETEEDSASLVTESDPSDSDAPHKLQRRMSPCALVSSSASASDREPESPARVMPDVQQVVLGSWDDECARESALL